LGRAAGDPEIAPAPQREEVGKARLERLVAGNSAADIAGHAAQLNAQKL